MKYNFIFWQRMLCIHQSAHARSLSEMGHQVTVVAAENISQERATLGWKPPNLGKVNILIAPSHNDIAQLVNFNPRETINFIIGTRGWELGKLAYKYCKKCGAHAALILEGGDPRGIKGFARKISYTYDRLWLNRNIKFLLCMGENGIKWYKSCGWPEEKIFPYAYFLETPEKQNNKREKEAKYNIFKIIYVGQLIKRKGIDILLKALTRINYKRYQLDLVGDGPCRLELESLAISKESNQNIFFHGVLPNDKCLKLIADADLLVLPSRFDGWGAVVNEALMQGVPVICSNFCGASSLLKDVLRGSIFLNDSEDSLTALIEERIQAGKKKSEVSELIQAWSNNISGQVAARYLLDVINHVYHGGPRPFPAWYLKT